MSINPLDQLPDNVVIELLAKSCPECLRAWEVVCKRFRTLVVEQQLWRQKCAKQQLSGVDFSTIKVSCSEIQGVVQDVLPNLQHEAYLSSLLFKKLFTVLESKDDSHSLVSEKVYSLVLHGIHATSTDHQHENIQNTVTLNHFRPVEHQQSAYWSSTGSGDPKITDTLTYCLAHPLCIVRKLQIRPFRAFFQRGCPVYAPSLFRMRACNSLEQQFYDQRGNPRDPSDLEYQFINLHVTQIQQQQENQIRNQPYQSIDQEVVPVSMEPDLQNNVSEVFPVRKQNSLQEFQLSEPIACIGGTVQLDLIGRTQIQEGIDDKYYNCIAVARFIGDPVYNFRICYDGQGDMVLKYWEQDSLLGGGGLDTLTSNRYAEEQENNLFPLWFQVQHEQQQLEDDDDDELGGLEINLDP